MNINRERENKMQATKSRRAAVMIACLYINMCSFGMFSALGVIYVELISAFQCKRSEAALVQSFYLGLSLGDGLLFTWIVTKYDTGLCVTIASLIMGIAIACGSLARDIGTVIALVGVVAGLFASVNTLSSFTVINWMFVNNRKFALSMLTLAPTIGQTVLPYITDAFMEEYSWSGTFLILGALTFLNCIPCGLIIHYSKRYFTTEKDASTAGKKATCLSSLTDAAFMTHATTALVFTTFGPVEMWFIVDVTVLKGFGIQSGATLLSLTGISGFMGRIACMIGLKFYPNTRPEVHMCYGFLVFGIAHFSIIVSSVYWGMLLGMIFRGISVAIISDFLPCLMLELRGPESFPQTLAITNMLMGVGDVLGGFIGGFSADVTGSYNLIFYIASVGAFYCATGMIIIYMIIKRRKRHSGQYHQLP